MATPPEGPSTDSVLARILKKKSSWEKFLPVFEAATLAAVFAESCVSTDMNGSTSTKTLPLPGFTDASMRVINPLLLESTAGTFICDKADEKEANKITVNKKLRIMIAKHPTMKKNQKC